MQCFSVVFVILIRCFCHFVGDFLLFVSFLSLELDKCRSEVNAAAWGHVILWKVSYSGRGRGPWTLMYVWVFVVSFSVKPESSVP